MRGDVTKLIALFSKLLQYWSMLVLRRRRRRWHTATRLRCLVSYAFRRRCPARSLVSSTCGLVRSFGRRYSPAYTLRSRFFVRPLPRSTSGLSCSSARRFALTHTHSLDLRPRSLVRLRSCSQPAPTERPSVNFSPRIRILRILFRGGRRIRVSNNEWNKDVWKTNPSE